MVKIHNPNSYENLDPYNQSRIEENFYKPSQTSTVNYINNSNSNRDLRIQELQEQRLMRKAYCKANNIPYEEPELVDNSSDFGRGALKVSVIIVWLFIVGVILSALIGEGNFLTNFMKAWF